MAPTVFREGPYRFFFFSREEKRRHVHVQVRGGEAKFWLDPAIELAVNFGLTQKEVSEAERLVREHEDEIRRAWDAHFGS